MMGLVQGFFSSFPNLFCSHITIISSSLMLKVDAWHAEGNVNLRWLLNWLPRVIYISYNSFCVADNSVLPKRPYKFLMWFLEHHHLKSNFISFCKTSFFLIFFVDGSSLCEFIDKNSYEFIHKKPYMLIYLITS